MTWTPSSSHESKHIGHPLLLLLTLIALCTTYPAFDATSSIFFFFITNDGPAGITINERNLGSIRFLKPVMN